VGGRQVKGPYMECFRGMFRIENQRHPIVM
jgi:hypothetical protein